MKSIEIMLLATGHFPLPAGSQVLSLMANIKLNILNEIKFPNSNKDFSVWSIVSVVWLPLAVLYVQQVQGHRRKFSWLREATAPDAKHQRTLGFHRKLL